MIIAILYFVYMALGLLFVYKRYYDLLHRFLISTFCYGVMLLPPTDTAATSVFLSVCSCFKILHSHFSVSKYKIYTTSTDR